MTTGPLRQVGLRPGSTLVLGPSGVTAVARGRAPAFVATENAAAQAALVAGGLGPHAAALGDHVIAAGSEALDAIDAIDVSDHSDGVDGAVRARLVELDRAFAGWIPGFVEREVERLAQVQDMHARRRALPTPRAARPTLPSSTVRRAALITSRVEGTVLLDDDLDGLSILLAGAPGNRVYVREEHAAHRAWLADEAARVGVTLRFEAPATGECDAAVVAVSAPRETAAALGRAIEAVRPGGLIFAQVRAPFDGRFLREVEEAKLGVVDHHREVDLVALPGPYVLDSAGDLVVLTRTPEAAPPADPGAGPGAQAAAVRSQPYYWLDFDDLAEERLGAGALERLAEVLSAHRGVAGDDAMRSILRSEGREVLAWFGPDGAGLTAELARAERHLLVTLMPYDPDLELAVQWATFHTLGDDFTRMRPLLTVHHRKESIVG